MRKVVAGAVVAVALAWANGGRADDTKTEQQRKQEQQSATGQPGSQSAGTAVGHESAVGGTDRTSREMRSDARADQHAPTGRSDERKHPLFDGKKNFDLDGKVQQASKDEITIQRDKLPPATLHVAPGTKVEVDGKASSVDQLQPGQDVKASFNLRGGTAEAVEIKADKLGKNDRKEMSEQRRENQKDANERARDQSRDQMRK
ncbi:MAG TPA: hypothetical protein VF894_01780 [Anaeromyxobacter sp.]